MPVVTEASTIAEHLKLRRPRNQFNQSILETIDPDPEIPSIIQSTACKSTISSILLSTFSNSNTITTNNDTTIIPSRKKNNFSSATFRGLGCTVEAAAQVSVPAAIRASADWEGKKVRKKKKKQRNSQEKKNWIANSNNDGCMVVQDVWCGNGFYADAASVDCVVARRNVSVSGRAKIDGEKINEREHSCLARRTVNPNTLSFLDSETAFLRTRPGSELIGRRYHRHARHPSPEGLAETVLLQSRFVMGGRLNSHDRFSDMRLDVDNLSYEELLELGERIGYVNTGLKEEEILNCVTKSNFLNDQKTKHLNGLSTHLSTQLDLKCSICQEECDADDEFGKLACGHSYHLQCIKQWLAQKNTCPICKAEAKARH